MPGKTTHSFFIRRQTFRFILSSFILITAFSAGALAQTPQQAAVAAEVKARYTKIEQMILMRDGVRLFTAIYVPKDAAQQKKYPILLVRTPYSVAPYGPKAFKDSLGPSPAFVTEGYIFAYQDVRGKFMSEGEFVNMRPHKEGKKTNAEIDESTDTYDTVEWLVKNILDNNGRVGMWGISYPGFYVSSGIIDSHPALRAVSPQAPIADWFIGDDFHHNGTLFLPHAFNFLASFGLPRAHPTAQPSRPFVHGTSDGYEFFRALGPLANADTKYLKGQVAFWNEMMQHGTYDEYWQARNLLPHLKNIRPAVMTVGGWFDAEDLYGALHTYQTIEKNNPQTNNILVMGPWYHGGWSRSDGESLGPVSFGSKTGSFYRENIELPFFNFYLKDKGELRLPEAYVFETGRNAWRTYEAWPPKNSAPRNIYLRAGGALSFDAMDKGKENKTAAYDEYVSDPQHPVPFISEVNIGMTREYMTEDQRFAARRPDVLTYETEALAGDVTLAGPIKASLYVSTSGTDSDFVVKLIDVFPDDAPDTSFSTAAGTHMSGYQMLVRGEPMRAKFRRSFSTPEPMKPGAVTKIDFTLPDANHTFMKGHRIMVQIQSSWFPLVDLNPQKFIDIYHATAADFQKATERVYHAGKYDSHLILNVLQ